MLTLTQITAHTWHLTGAKIATIEFDADHADDACSFAGNRFPGRPITLDVQSYASSVSELSAELAAA